MIIEKSEVEQLRIELREFKSRSFIDVRTFYLLDGVWTATRKGATIPLDRAEEVAKAVVKEASKARTKPLRNKKAA